MGTAYVVSCLLVLILSLQVKHELSPAKAPVIPVASIVSQSFYEGDKVTKVVKIPVKLKNKTVEALTVKYVITDITAVMGKDYTANATGLISFPIGSNSADILVTVNGDEVIGPNKDFKIVISEFSHGAIEKSEAVITIKNDD